MKSDHLSKPGFFAVCLVFSMFHTINALTAFPMKMSMEKNETAEFGPVFQPYSAVAKTLTLHKVSEPVNGLLTVVPGWKVIADWYPYSGDTLPGFRYTPSNNFTGVDSFSFYMDNGSGASNTVWCRIKVHPAEPGGMTILLIVNSSLLPKISAEVNRLKSDMENEGYVARIIPWVLSGSSLTGQCFYALRDTLIKEYEASGRFLAGSILIGRVPVSGNPGDWQDNGGIMGLWNMNAWAGTVNAGDFVAFGRALMQVWATRMWASSDVDTMVHSAYKCFGDDAKLLKRLLQANHDYRTGVSRFSYTVKFRHDYEFAAPAYGNYREYLEVFPRVDTAILRVNDNLALYREWIYGTDAYEVYDYSDHESGGLSPDDLFSLTTNFRVLLANACVMGVIGFGPTLSANVFEHLLTRHTGCVLGVGGITATGGFLDLPMYENDCGNTYGLSGPRIGNTKKKMRSLLHAGERWGSAWIQSGMEIRLTNVFGDMSLKPMMFPSNAPPVVSLTADRVSGASPLTVNLSCSAQDTDGGAVTSYEWFPEDYNGIDDTAIASGPSLTSLRHTYVKPYHYKARVEVVDNYKARTIKKIDINVAPAAGETLRVRCGYPCFGAAAPGFLIFGGFIDHHDDVYEVVDSQGHIWRHDQDYYPGGWGSVYPIRDSMGCGETGNGQSKPNSSFENWVRQLPIRPIWYKIPVTNGGYKLTLGFMEILQGIPYVKMPDTAIMDIEVNGAPWRQGFSPFRLVGANKALFINTTVLVDSNMLEFKIKPHDSLHYIFLNNFQVSPTQGTGIPGLSPAEVAEGLSVWPNPFNPAVCIEVRSFGPAEISLWDMGGRCVRKFSFIAGGKHTVIWDGRDKAGRPVASGMYCLAVKSNGNDIRKKLFLLR